METTIFNVSGLQNSQMANKLKNAVTSINGVSNCTVDMTASKVTVTYDPATTDLSYIKSTISGSGFSVKS